MRVLPTESVIRLFNTFLISRNIIIIEDKERLKPDSGIIIYELLIAPVNRTESSQGLPIGDQPYTSSHRGDL